MDEQRELALMDNDRWRCWGYTAHQGTLIISALRHFPFPCLHVISCDWTQLIT
ncbi:unnamed protein product [Staurois parvus]|uniref:Uncharacterized protein n=1 Tax=Staurois parvus TaxID=386267 RepID=A0ABN9B453_9NEOB|nr:unnamed protein product [Staurois parvus]